jgi:hypothetical protein
MPENIGGIDVEKRIGQKPIAPSSLPPSVAKPRLQCRWCKQRERTNLPVSWGGADGGNQAQE